MSSLTRVVIEIEQHAARDGWEQPARLYALVDTADLLSQRPQLADQLGIGVNSVGPGALTPVEQEPLPADQQLDDVLAGIAWPARVLGCAVTMRTRWSCPDRSWYRAWPTHSPRPSRTSSALQQCGHRRPLAVRDVALAGPQGVQ